jgi:hypothetical protein
MKLRNALVMMVVLGVFAPFGAPSAQAPPGQSAQPGERALAPTASDGGRAELLPARPVAPDADPVMRLVADTMVDGLVVSVTIDGATVTLDSAVLARVPRRQARADRAVEGDQVRATAFIGNQSVATTVVPDNVLNASEGGGLVRTDKRQISLALAADRPVDTVTIEALATNARATLDVRQAYARACEADRSSKWCRR